jgi:hypothetical protein
MEEEENLIRYEALHAAKPVRCTIRTKGSDGSELIVQGTFLGLIRNADNETSAIVHVDGEPLLDMVDTAELTLESDE